MLIKVKVEADARQEHLEQTAQDSFCIAVREPAKENRANDRVRDLLAAHFGVSVSRVSFVSGHLKSAKKFEVTL